MLVGVINADAALHLADFRASERTCQLVTQVAGRSGRGPRGGRVVVQRAHRHPAMRATQFMITRHLLKVNCRFESHYSIRHSGV